MKRAVHARLALSAMLTTALVGCALQHTKPPKAPDYSELMQRAQSRYEAHDFNGAKALYKKATEVDPTRSAPWHRLAQISFDEQNYGRAIVDAREVLRRNPSDLSAQSILTISGLRVSIEALGRMRNQADLQGPAQAVAQELASMMREVLGQDVLVPPATPSQTEKRPAVRRTSSARKPAVPLVASPPKAKTPPATSANPFLSLPGGHSRGD